MKMPSFSENWSQYQAQSETALTHALNQYLPNSAVEKHSDLIEAIAYSCLDGGKRLRASLVYAIADVYDLNLKTVDAPACAVELIHCYSLVHDDMPEMDNDRYRRGKLSTHAKYNPACALLVGDNLQTLAFDILSDDNAFISNNNRLKMIQCLAKASGNHGMIGGQAIDLALSFCVNSNAANNIEDIGNASLLDELKILHLMKTGALIKSSLNLGAIAANASKEDINALNDYGHHIGLLFQITDDILDETSNDKSLGKTVGKDKALNKLTYTTLLGLKQAKIEADNHCLMAKEAIENLSRPADFLLQLADFIRKRDK